MTEKQLQEAIVKLARLRGWMHYHVFDARRSTPGFPDLIMVHPRTGQFLAAELKSDVGKLTLAQWEWIGALRRAGLCAVVWRPSDLRDGTIKAALTPWDVRRGAA